MPPPRPEASARSAAADAHTQAARAFARARPPHSKARRRRHSPPGSRRPLASSRVPSPRCFVSGWCGSQLPQDSHVLSSSLSIHQNCRRASAISGIPPFTARFTVLSQAAQPTFRRAERRRSPRRSGGFPMRPTSLRASEGFSSSPSPNAPAPTLFSIAVEVIATATTCVLRPSPYESATSPRGFRAHSPMSKALSRPVYVCVLRKCSNEDKTLRAGLITEDCPARRTSPVGG